MPCAKRFVLLYSFLKRNMSKKVMVFFSSCNSVKFYADLLKYINIECFDIHGKQKQQRRTSTFFDFCKAQKGFLLCTNVAARGLDIPSVVSGLVLQQFKCFSIRYYNGELDGCLFTDLFVLSVGLDCSV